MQKLCHYGFSNCLLDLFKFYLLGREQYVKYRGFISKVIRPTSGVPQGSNLGPLLFLLFINDIVDTIPSEKLLFADDVKLFQIIRSIDDCMILQASLIAIRNWCIKNRLFLNISKCCSVTYTRKVVPKIFSYAINDTVIKRSDSFKDLGVLFDTKFTFIDHINDIVAKAFNTDTVDLKLCVNSAP